MGIRTADGHIEYLPKLVFEIRFLRPFTLEPWLGSMDRRTSDSQTLFFPWPYETFRRGHERDFM